MGETAQNCAQTDNGQKQTDSGYENKVPGEVVSASTGCDYDYTDLAECVERVHGEVQPLAPGGELLLQGEEPRHTVHPRHRHPGSYVLLVIAH